MDLTPPQAFLLTGDIVDNSCELLSSVSEEPELVVISSDKDQTDIMYEKKGGELKMDVLTDKQSQDIATNDLDNDLRDKIRAIIDYHVSLDDSFDPNKKRHKFIVKVGGTEHVVPHVYINTARAIVKEILLNEFNSEVELFSVYWTGSKLKIQLERKNTRQRQNKRSEGYKQTSDLSLILEGLARTKLSHKSIILKTEYVIKEGETEESLGCCTKLKALKELERRKKDDNVVEIYQKVSLYLPVN